MTKPRIGDLLSGVAASLREEVLPEIPAGPARRQTQIAIAIIRRVAAVWDKVGPYLYEDNRDMEATLRRVSDILDRNLESCPTTAALRKRLATIEHESTAAGEYPSPAQLEARNLELQQLLVEVQEALHGGLPATGTEKIACPGQGEIDGILRALFRRMLEREAEITAPALPRTTSLTVEPLESENAMKSMDRRFR